MDISLRSEALSCTLTTRGGAIWHLDALTPGGTMPLLRPPPAGEARSAMASGCFPLVPFGNRIADNRFTIDARSYALSANVAGDAHRLHGDGWLAEWRLLTADDHEASLGFSQAASRHSPFAYEAQQTFALTGRSLTLVLRVTNAGEDVLPFGLGWHPFFPLTAGTTLMAASTSYWTERAGWLPDQRTALPAELDFGRPRRLPRHWLNNGFEGWPGTARIVWPERGLSLDIEADGVLGRYFLFVSDAGFDPSYAHDYFCFEPMSHSPNAHNLADGGGLRRLAPGEAMSARLRLTWSSSGPPSA